MASDLGGATDPLREIKDEAEDLLRVLDSESTDEVAEEVTEDVLAEEEAETPATDESEDTQTMPASKDVSGADEEAQLLDEESADPEIQLDLARA